MRILTAAETRRFDARAVDELGVSALVLMENAALGVVDALGQSFPGAERVAVLCGPGNNGADGMAVARQLLTRGYAVEPWLATFGASRSPELELQRSILERLGRPPVELGPGDLQGFAARAAECDVVIDALFGVGLRRPLEGSFAQLVASLPGRVPVLAIDLPSGLDADVVTPIGPAVRADLTVTFVAPKPAHVLDPACDLCGEVVVADLGVPFDPGGGAGALHLLTREELGRALPVRPAAAHKGSFGHVLVVAGSAGKAGAMVLTARAAVIAGAGLTTVAMPVPLAASLAAGCPEAMSLPLPAGEGGTLAPAALPALLEAAASRGALALGPGLGRDAGTDDLVHELVAATTLPLVLDADGLNAYAGRLEALAARRGTTVLTPHPGELGRLMGREVAAIEGDRLAAAREAAERSGALVVLKGRRTVIASPDGEAWINDTGGPHLASGGSGDVLTGLVAARLAQADAPDFAACLSVHWHGLAGDLAAERLGGPAVPAGELIVDLPRAFSRIGEAS